MTTATDTVTYVVRIDLDGRPFMRQYVEATTDEEALALVQTHLDADPEAKGETAAHAEPLQPIFDRIIERVADGVSYSLSFKHESGTLGPVVICDHDLAKEQGADGPGFGVPFGTEPDYYTKMPWMRRSEARRLAKYLGVPYSES